jgi:predicted SAM-dependent methyltransferase
VIEDAPFAPASFDVITSLSVVEHIRDNQAAVQTMWKLLKPGGRLVLSVPCMAMAEEQYINVDHFGLQSADQNGFYFLQYVYDQALLEERFFSVLGRPSESVIYGEKRRGSLREGLVKKWEGTGYPMWREPYTMWQDFQPYDSIAELPGEGVIIMGFDHP